MNSIRRVHIEKAFKEALPLRYRCIWCIGIDTGLRISDILHLKRHQVRAGTWLQIDQKTKKKNKCTISKETQELCNALMIAEHYKKKRLLFFNPATKKPYTRQMVWKVFSTTAKKVKEEHIGAHSSRHTAAWKLYKTTGSIEAVRKFLNHASADTTMRYLKNKRFKKSA